MSLFELSSQLQSHHVFVDYVIDDLLRWREDGLAGALVTLVGVDGSSPRPVGSQMAVNERGEWVGNLTSGCAEAAVVEAAVDTIGQGQARLERYGRGSRYVDVQLPCGSGIDIYFDPLVPTEQLVRIAGAHHARQPIALEFGHHPDAPSDHRTAAVAEASDGPRSLVIDAGRTFHRVYTPPIRVDIAGRGPSVTSLAVLANALGWSVTVSSPDSELLGALEPVVDAVAEIILPDRFDGRFIDSSTASVLLFHDHDWEPAILLRVLKSPAFYVGALGSRRTHAQRCDALAGLGCSDDHIARIFAPIGLDIGALSPPEIALAISSEILSVARGHTSIGEPE